MVGNRTLRKPWIVALGALALAACRAAPASDRAEPATTTVTARKSDAVPAGTAAEEPPEASIRERARAMARYVQGDAPVYPEMSRRLGEEGTVELAIGVLHDGSVSALAIGRSSGYPRLDAAALTAARTWRFNPRTGGGEVETISYRVVFELVEGE
jgi:protein TonB